MSDITRRSLFAAGAIAAAGVATAGGWFVFHIRQPRGPYDDILAQIPDRDAAVRVGQALLKRMDAQVPNDLYRPTLEPKGLAESLRKRPLIEAMADDAAKGRVVEVDGWVMPVSFAAACMLAAKVA